MSEEKLQNILKIIYEELSVDKKDEEYINYLKEKIYKAYNYAKSHNISEEEFIQKIKQIIPNFLANYERLKNNVSFISNSNNTNFGISINFQLIDLFDIADVCTSNEEFINLRNKYFEKLGNDPRFHGFNYIFPGLENITYEQVINIRKNIISNVDCITPEWSGKMRMIIDIRKPLFVNGKVNMEIFDFQYLDKIADFARKNNIKLRMHNIIWHEDFRPFLENATKEQIYKFLDVYMGELSKRYSDVFYSIDVLNEIASDTPDSVLRDSKWRKKLGDDYFIEILRIAKENFSNVELYYNEYGEERQEKRKNIIEIINRIKAIEEKEGIKLLDGIGVQSHYSSQTTDDSIKEAYFDYSKTGKKIQVTELDVTNEGNQQDFDYETNRVFRTVLDCASSCGVDLLNLWGVSSDISWRSKKVNNYLDQDGNISVYSTKLIECYSKKRKYKKFLEVDNADNDIEGDSASIIK